MNNIILSGRLTKSPEVRYTQSGKVVCTFTLAVDRHAQEGQQQTDFIPIVVWGKLAEACGNCVDKGSKVIVEGKLQIRSYDGKDGKKKLVSEVIAHLIEFLDRKNKEKGAEQFGNEEETFQF